MKRTRIQAIRAYVVSNRTATLEQICGKFQISMSTLRRDLKELTKERDIRKSYGVLSAHPAARQLPFEERYIANSTAKSRIAERAARLVVDNDIIFIDSGTTTMYLVDHLRDRSNVTVITNSLEVIRRAYSLDNLTVITLSGVLNRALCSFAGAAAASVLSGYNINRAFLATAGIARDFSITNAFVSETDLKKMAIARSQRRILLADATKFGVLSLCTYCQLEEVDTLVTDREPPQEYLARLREVGKELIVCPAAPPRDA
jgi:DeoR family myo-inositol catabolism operon transcriptional repressor